MFGHSKTPSSTPCYALHRRLIWTSNKRCGSVLLVSVNLSSVPAHDHMLKIHVIMLTCTSKEQSRGTYWNHSRPYVSKAETLAVEGAVFPPSQICEWRLYVFMFSSEQKANNAMSGREVCSKVIIWCLSSLNKHGVMSDRREHNNLHYAVAHTGNPAVTLFQRSSKQLVWGAGLDVAFFIVCEI